MSNWAATTFFSRDFLEREGLSLDQAREAAPLWADAWKSTMLTLKGVCPVCGEPPAVVTDQGQGLIVGCHQFHFWGTSEGVEGFNIYWRPKGWSNLGTNA